MIKFPVLMICQQAQERGLPPTWSMEFIGRLKHDQIGQLFQNLNIALVRGGGSSLLSRNDGPQGTLILRFYRMQERS